MNNDIRIKRGAFLFLTFLYFLSSFFGFFFTSSGWTALVIGIWGIIFFVVNYLVFCGVIFGKRLTLLACSIKSLMTLAIIQIIALLFNMGDYTDAPGSRSFFEVILGRGYQSCHGTNDYLEPPLFGSLAVLLHGPHDCNGPPLLGSRAVLLAFGGVVSYLIALITVQVRTIRGSEKSW